MLKEKLLISGGNRLEGKVKASGAKNSVLKLMAAALLTSEECRIKNAPLIQDVLVMGEVLRKLGAEVDYKGSGVLTIKGTVNKLQAPYDLVSQMRASIIVLGPLLARFGEARVAQPGGCNIGSRKIDMHLKGLKSLGAEIETRSGYIVAKAGRLKGASITLDFPSVGATENILTAAVLAQGETVIENAAREPEITDLVGFLNLMGAKIKGKGSSTLTVQGVDSLGGASHQVVGDRIETGTMLLAGLITKGKVRVEGVKPGMLELFIQKLKEAGAEVKEDGDSVEAAYRNELKAIDVATFPYPGFPTDLQPQMSVLLSIAKGTSIVTENIFEKRFEYVDELNRMGSMIRIEGHHAVITGKRRFSGVPVKATDLRGGAALVLAGLAAKGETVIEGIYHIHRGYDHLEEKLNGLGARTEVIKET